MKKYLLPEKGNFYKANLHAHTNMSDGRDTPEEVKEIFKKMLLDDSYIKWLSEFMKDKNLIDNLYSTINSEDKISPDDIKKIEYLSKKVAISFDAAWGADKTQGILDILYFCFESFEYMFFQGFLFLLL